ncbi:MAG: anti-sigma factor [Herminiimonas sp.]|nr:anti-sigma factor [Herminiimonas sp.]
MNIARNERLLDKLAAEYVLGTLKGGARRRYEDWLRRDPMVRRATAEWQDRLHPMAQFAPAATPSPQVWKGIARQLGLAANPAVEAKRAFWRGLRDDLGFWRGLGMASTAVATILVAVLATRSPEAVAPVASYVAMLADDKAQPVAIVTGDAIHHTLVVKVVLPQTVAADRSLQLWAVPKSGTPRPLGLVAGDGTVTLPLAAGDTPQAVSLLAISLEQKGGSPNPNGPTGPIVYKGAWLSL